MSRVIIYDCIYLQLELSESSVKIKEIQLQKESVDDQLNRKDIQHCEALKVLLVSNTIALTSCKSNYEYITPLNNTIIIVFILSMYYSCN